MAFIGSSSLFLDDAVVLLHPKGIKDILNVNTLEHVDYSQSPHVAGLTISVKGKSPFVMHRIVSADGGSVQYRLGEQITTLGGDPYS